MAVNAEILLDALACQSTCKLKEFNGQELANTAWAFATMTEGHIPLFAAISADVQRQLRRGSARFRLLDLTYIAWSFARATFPDRPLFNAIAGRATMQLNDSDIALLANPQELSNLVWAFASFAFLHRPMMTVISSTAQTKIAEFDAQNLAMTAWAWSTLAVSDWPLIAAISQAALECQGSFDEMEIASLLWSIVTHPKPTVSAVPEEDFLKSLSCVSVITNGIWSGHSLCLLANALYKVRETLDASIWEKVENRWLTELQQIAALLRRLAYPVDPDTYILDLQGTGCYHVGPRYTSHLLSMLDVEQAPEIFAKMSYELIRHKGSSLGNEDSAGEAGILCIADYNLGVGSEARHVASVQQLVVHSLSASLKIEHGEEHLSWEGLVPAPLAHDRSGHAEFRALVGIFHSLRKAGIDTSSKEERQLVVGTAFFYVTHHPCLSCVGAFAQFRSAFPKVTLQVSYDWTPGNARGR